jgi:hypothetical protein
LAILDYFQDGLTPELRAKAALLQQRNLFYRFLMYGYPDFAWRLADSLQDPIARHSRGVVLGAQGPSGLTQSKNRY